MGVLNARSGNGSRADAQFDYFNGGARAAGWDPRLTKNYISAGLLIPTRSSSRPASHYPNLGRRLSRPAGPNCFRFPGRAAPDLHGARTSSGTPEGGVPGLQLSGKLLSGTRCPVGARTGAFFARRSRRRGTGGSSYGRRCSGLALRRRGMRPALTRGWAGTVNRGIRFVREEEEEVRIDSGAIWGFGCCVEGKWLWLMKCAGG